MGQSAVGRCFCYFNPENDQNFSSEGEKNDLKKTQRSLDEAPFKSYIKVGEIINKTVVDSNNSEAQYYLTNTLDEDIKIKSTSGGRYSLIKSLEDKPKIQKTISKEDFHFLKVIGRGSFGKVMLVERKNSGIFL